MKGIHWSEYKSIDIDFNYDKYHTLRWPIQYSSIKPAKRETESNALSHESCVNKLFQQDVHTRSTDPFRRPCRYSSYKSVVLQRENPWCPWSGWPHLRDAVLQRDSLGVEEALEQVYSQDCDQSESGEMSAEHWVRTPFSRHPTHRENPASQAELFPEVTVWYQRPKDA